MAFQWGGRTWEANQLADFVTYLNAHGVAFSDWASNHPQAAASFYDPGAYVPGGSSHAVATAIQNSGYGNEGNPPLDQIPDVPRTSGDSTPGNVPAPPPDDNLGGGYDSAKASSAAGRAQTNPATAPSYPDPSQGGQPGGFGTGSAVPASDVAPTTAPGQSSLNDLIDWSRVLGQYGLPPDIVAQINAIFTRTGGNLDQAIPIAQAFIRGTQWYTDTYPGIQAGINAGLFADEQGYRAYKNQVDQIFQQYYGRMATSAEVANYASTGKSVNQIAAVFQGQATLGTISDPLRALFSDDELLAMANEQAGIDTSLGQSITQKADLAMKVGSLYTDFYGRPITRAELDDLTKNGTSADQVAKQLATQANINGMNPAIRDLFTPDEIRQIALSAAGGTTELGQLLAQKAQLAASLNSVYHSYSGQGVSRQEVEDAWSQGLTASEVQSRLQASALSGSAPDFIKQIFSQDQLQLAASATAGANLSAEALAAQRLVNAAPDYQSVLRQYENRNVTADEVSQFVNAGTSADLLSRQYQAKGIVASRGADFQQATGSFGEGQLSGDQLSTLGQEQAGIDTILGQQLQAKLEKAQQRLAGVFQGTIAKPSLSVVAGKLVTGLNQTSDTGA